MHTPVSFESAKLLKEKRFPQPESVYQASQHGLHFTWYNSDGVYMASYKLDDTVSAPTIAEAVMWLYEKHGIWIEVRKHTRNGLRCFSPYINNKPVREDVFFNDYDSPTEAYEAAIKYILTNSI